MSEFPAASYDAWKTRSPDDEEYRHYPFGRCQNLPITCQFPRCECDKFNCWACCDLGWIDDDGHVVPCSECGAEVTL